MMCDGCVNAVKRIISKMDGVVDSSVSLEVRKIRNA